MAVSITQSACPHIWRPVRTDFQRFSVQSMNDAGWYILKKTKPHLQHLEHVIKFYTFSHTKLEEDFFSTQCLYTGISAPTRFHVSGFLRTKFAFIVNASLIFTVQQTGEKKQLSLIQDQTWLRRRQASAVDDSVDVGSWLQQRTHTSNAHIRKIVDACLCWNAAYSSVHGRL